MSDLNERELDLKDYLYYAFKEFSPKGGIWMKYLEHWDEAYTQLVKMVEGHFKYKYLDNDPECYHVADQGQVDEGILRCLQMVRDTITTMEDNFNAGRPGFSCDVIDEIDKAINFLTQKRTVTREWMEHKAGYLVERFSGECSLTTLQRFGIMTVLTEKGDMEDLLQELGYEVVDKK